DGVVDEQFLNSSSLSSLLPHVLLFAFIILLLLFLRLPVSVKKSRSRRCISSKSFDLHMLSLSSSRLVCLHSLLHDPKVRFRKRAVWPQGATCLRALSPIHGDPESKRTQAREREKESRIGDGGFNTGQLKSCWCPIGPLD